MTLLELLVKELPERGGWPEGASHAGYTRTWGGVSFTRGGTPAFNGDDLSIFTFHGADDKAFWLSGPGFDCDKPVDYATAIITREQYEAAISAQQPVWDGEGLPPVGVTCEAKYNHYSSGWFIFECVGVSNGIAFGFADGAAVHVQGDEFTFRPIRTEADRKREVAIQAMYEVVRQSGYDTPEPVAIYEAIAAGKIPGVEISK